MKTTKAFAKEVLDLWKDKSCLFNGSMTEGQFQSKLECLGIRQEEAIVITMSLIVAGAKFSNN
jgi:hypothetical protein